MAITFRVKSCAAADAAAAAGAESAARKDFFSGIRKIGDLQVLNDIGLGGAGHALRTFAKVSDSIRTGRGTIAALLGGALDTAAEGANAVLGALGISDAVMQTLKSLKPEVANQALGQAKQLFQKIKQGNFTLDDIPEFLSDFQNLEELITNIFHLPDGGSLFGGQQSVSLCAPSPWAVDLINYAPKYKFLFVVQFDFDPVYSSLNQLNFAFVVKNSTRPTIDFEYDDVNFYNFHSKVVKRMTYQPIEMRFYDDDYNQAMLFYNAYLKAISPVSNLSFEDAQMGSSGILEEGGMSFGTVGNKVHPGPITTREYSASIGPLAGGAKNVLKRIAIFHIYRQGRLMNVYNFYNPKIESLMLDDLDMAENGGGNEVSLRFNYDSLYVMPGISMDPESNMKYNIEEINRGGAFPMKFRKDAKTEVTSDPFTPPNHGLAGPQQGAFEAPGTAGTGGFNTQTTGQVPNNNPFNDPNYQGGVTGTAVQVRTQAEDIALYGNGGSGFQFSDEGVDHFRRPEERPTGFGTPVERSVQPLAEGPRPEWAFADTPPSSWAFDEGGGLGSPPSGSQESLIKYLPPTRRSPSGRTVPGQSGQSEPGAPEWRFEDSADPKRSTSASQQLSSQRRNTNITNNTRRAGGSPPVWKFNE